MHTFITTKKGMHVFRPSYVYGVVLRYNFSNKFGKIITKTTHPFLIYLYKYIKS